MSIVVTGAAGFIGSNLVNALNQRGERDIIAVDNLAAAEKFHNLVDCEIQDYLDQDEFLRRIQQGTFDKVGLRAVFHQGACSDTMETDGRYMMANNFDYSQHLLDFCLRTRTPYLYASSAAVYGGSASFVEERAHEKPLNIYGYSKFLFDQKVRRVWAGAQSPVIGFRYFNVYGAREAHKGRMASVAFHHFNQYQREGKVKLFGAWEGYAAGCQQRDFVSVEDVVKVNLHFFDHPTSGIFNLGTGHAEPFNAVAVAVVNTLRQQQGQTTLSLEALQQQGLIEYIDFPEALKGKYQSYTQADITALRRAGYDAALLNVGAGVARYVQWLTQLT